MASITLDWNANPSTDNVTGYEVYGANGTGVAFGSCALLATVNALTWTETGLANGQARTYYLKAVNALGVSATPEGPLNITAAAASSTYVQNAGGTPSVQEGTHASRPAAGTAGRVYIETDTESIFRDNGASWDPIGGTAGALLAANNLSDVANEATSRSNLGAEPAATLNGINTQTASYTLVIGDAGLLVEMNVGSANNLTVPPNSSVAFAVNTRIDIVQIGAGQTTVVAGLGVTIHSIGGKLKLSNQYSGSLLYKRGTDEWVLCGDLAA